MSYKNFTTTVSSLFSGKFAFFASLASVLGLILLFIADKWAVFVALTFFICFLLGSEERDNATLKKILGDVCAERKKEGKSDNWVLCLGQIMASLNSHCSRMADLVSS